MTAVLKSSDFWTPQRRLFASQSPGRRPGRLAGGHVDDRVALKKAVQLCPSCRPKFDAERNNYLVKSNIPLVMGRCDGCGEFHRRMRMLCHSSLVSNL